MISIDQYAKELSGKFLLFLFSRIESLEVVVETGIVDIVEGMLHHNVPEVPVLGENGTDGEQVTNAQGHKGAPELLQVHECLLWSLFLGGQTGDGIP